MPSGGLDPELLRGPVKSGQSQESSRLIGIWFYITHTATTMLLPHYSSNTLVHFGGQEPIQEELSRRAVVLSRGPFAKPSSLRFHGHRQESDVRPTDHRAPCDGTERCYSGEAVKYNEGKG